MLRVDLEKAARDYNFTAVRFIDGDEDRAIYGPLFETDLEAQFWCDETNATLGYVVHPYEVAMLVRTCIDPIDIGVKPL